jgi:NAD(P)-dependent dehydrogenase (short-subunit alcohol dehydrogenase family)
MTAGPPPMEGMVCLVTGAARGLGAAAARELAGRGATVAAVTRSADDAQRVVEELGRGHVAVTADVRDERALTAAVGAVADQLGRIDVVVANAGINRHGDVHALGADTYAEVIETNLIGAYRTTRAALKPLVTSRGYLVFVSSVAAFASVGGMAAYASAKAGLDMLAHTLRLDLAPDGVDVGVFVPTWIETDMLGSAEAEIPQFAELRSSTAGLLSLLTDGVPGGPLGGSMTPAECAAALADGIQARARRIWAPPALEELWRASSILNSELGEQVTVKLFGGALS